MPRVYFLHIPKTAGTSFRIWLSRFFDAKRTLPADHLAELEAISDETLLQHDFYSGHFGWRMMERASDLGMDCEVVTIFRDPIDTYFSGFKFSSTVSEEEFAKAGKESQLLPILPEDISQLGLEKYCENIFGKTKRLNLDNMFARFFVENGIQSPERGIIDIFSLPLAIKRLEQMKFFGFAEHWAESAFLFAHAFGLPLKKFDLRLNTTTQVSPIFDRSIFAKFAERESCIDFEIYNLAKSMFINRLNMAKINLGLSNTASIDDCAKPLLENFLKTDRGLERISDASIPVSEDMVQDGFDHRYEYEGNWILWANQYVSSLYLPLDASRNLKLRFVLGVISSERIRNEIRIRVAGKDRPLRTEFVQSDGSPDVWHVHLTIEVPAGSLPDQHYTEISFVSPELVPVKTENLDTAFAFGLVGDILIQSL